jgi:hypothetical protein
MRITGCDPGESTSTACGLRHGAMNASVNAQVQHEHGTSGNRLTDIPCSVDGVTYGIRFQVSRPCTQWSEKQVMKGTVRPHLQHPTHLNA